MGYDTHRIPHSAQAATDQPHQAGQELHEQRADTSAAQAHTAVQPGAQTISATAPTTAAKSVAEDEQCIYLPEPRLIKGMHVRYTRHGARYLKEHWTQVMAVMPDKLTDKAHILRMIEVYDQTLELYSHE